MKIKIKKVRGERSRGICTRMEVIVVNRKKSWGGGGGVGLGGGSGWM